MRSDQLELEPTSAEKSGFKTSEWITTVGTVLLNIVAMCALVGFIQTKDVQTVTDSVTTIITSLQALVVSGAVVWKYIASRTGLKVATTQTQQMRMAMKMGYTMPMQMPMAMGMPPSYAAHQYGVSPLSMLAQPLAAQPPAAATPDMAGPIPPSPPHARTIDTTE